MTQRVRVLVAGAAALVVLAACGGSPATNDATPAPTVASTTVPSTTTTTAATTTTTSTTTTTLPPAIAVGSNGPEVAAIQQRLVALGYWTGETGGTFGEGTRHAVVAFQKVQGLARDGAVGPATEAALASASRPAPSSGSGHAVEVDLTHQVLRVADGGATTWVFDASTGAVAGTTPGGYWSVFLGIEGYEHGDLGVLYRPRYFAPRVAVHGYPDVPSWPASHGCVRVPNATMDFIWASNLMPLGGTVTVT